MEKEEEKPKIEIPEVSLLEVARNIFFILLAVGVAYYVVTQIGLDGLREKVEHAGIYAPLLVIFLKTLTIVVAPLGGAPLFATSPLISVIEERSSTFTYWFAIVFAWLPT